MALTKEEATVRARADLAARLGVAENEIATESAEDADFPDANFGANMKGEVSAQMITPGWRIRLRANGSSYEYRANRNRLRLFNFKGANHRVI
ncbi:MAG TPA: hypothetical protein VE821_09780 [Pyrinomonadaceae bacterium]|nr:hypothetical protein [Pyrinomonadaceae bacterium]